MKNKAAIENKDYTSEIDGKTHYLRKITLPQKIVEGDRWIEFKGAPLSFECFHIDELTMDNPHKTAYIEFDFGMQNEIPLLPQDNFILSHMDKDATDEDRMIFDVIFDLFHAFHHTEVDPNYTHYHWALYGNLKDRVEIGDDDET